MAVDPSQQVPPELMALLGGGGAPPPAGPPMAGPPPPGPPPGGPPPSDSGDPGETLRAWLTDQLSPLDPMEDAAIADIVAKFKKLIAAQAGEAEAAMGVSKPQKFMRRQAVGGAA